MRKRNLPPALDNEGYEIEESHNIGDQGTYGERKMRCKKLYETKRSNNEKEQGMGTTTTTTQGMKTIMTDCTSYEDNHY